jgi:hypothetical protein
VWCVVCGVWCVWCGVVCGVCDMCGVCVMCDVRACVCVRDTIPDKHAMAARRSWQVNTSLSFSFLSSLTHNNNYKTTIDNKKRIHNNNKIKQDIIFTCRGVCSHNYAI